MIVDLLRSSFFSDPRLVVLFHLYHRPCAWHLPQGRDRCRKYWSLQYTAPSLTGSLVKGRHLPYPRSWPYPWDTCSQWLAATGRYLTSFWHNSEGQVQLHSSQKDRLKFYLHFWISLNNFLWPIMSSSFSYGRISWERIPKTLLHSLFSEIQSRHFPALQILCAGKYLWLWPSQHPDPRPICTHICPPLIPL